MTTHPTVYLKDYQPYPFSILSVELEFDIYDEEALVRNHMQIQRLHPGEFYLYGDALELVEVSIDGEVLSATNYKLTSEKLTLPHCPDNFSITIITRIRPQDNTQLSGLYRSKNMFCTQCEAEGFRRITFYPDRPDVLSVFKTTIRANKEQCPILLSNGNRIAIGELEDGRHWATWHDPFKKPSYLFALVAGQLGYVREQFTTQSGQAITLEIYVEPGNESQCEHAMASLKRAMRWDEEHYGREYDLSIFMIVAVSDFNMGAMENKGLNIFNSKYILARKDMATDQDYINIESVVAHEYFHNWTGNRITCRDWFQLSLKEGLTVFRDQEFTRDMHSRDMYRIADVNELRTIQFPEDAGSMAHPVQPNSYQEINNFYTATIYNKGAEVIRMQHTLLGKAGFRRGMDLYFKRHDGQAVTIEDFVRAMEDANGVNLTQFKRWYTQAGTPQVSVSTEFNEGRLTLNFKQICRPTPEMAQKLPFHIPITIALFDYSGAEIPLHNALIELTESQQSVHYEGLSSRPVVSLLRDFSAPIALEQCLSQEELLILLRYETNGYARWNAAQTLYLDCLKEGYTQASFDAWQVCPILLNALGEILNHSSIDALLRAELLTPPSFEEAANALTEVNVTQLEAVRDRLRADLGRAVFNQALKGYQQLWQREDHAMTTEAFARRRLRNTCLWLMMKSEPEKSLSLCQQQFAEARTMTDRMVSLGLLVNCPGDVGDSALAEFYTTWQTNDLVLEKWFVLQASSEAPDTLNKVQALLNHQAFSFKNPNKVRALIGAFIQNPRHFHAIDGSGYAFLKEMLIKLDKINSQISARLATPFTRWQRLDEPRQQLIQAELQQLAKLKLSRDLSEIVEKSLER